MSEVVRLLTEIGKQVDAVMLSYLQKGAQQEFIPIVQHQVAVGGKRVRPALTMLSCEAAGGKAQDALLPAAMIELIHNYSLIMDDLIDRGDIRRGSPTVRAKYGEATALLAGMFYREVLDEVVSDGPNPTKMRALLVETIKETIEGERLDILMEQAGRTEEYLRKRRLTDASIELYFDLIEKKTAALFRSACLAGGLSIDAGDEALKGLGGYGWKIGLAFQVTDDYLDIFGEKTGKQKGKDIYEHKLGNAAIIMAMQEMPRSDAEKLLRVLRSKKVTAPKMRLAYRLIEKTNSRGKTLELAKSLVEEGNRALEILPNSTAKKNMIELADFVAERLY